jgi:3-hydroxyisobutyrate dehydrogenase
MEQQQQQGHPSVTVAVLGAGTMGSAMSRRLLSRGFALRVWNRSADPLEALAERGAETFSDAPESVRLADVVVTVLPTAEVVGDVMLSTGVLDSMRPGTVWAQMGTIGVEGTERLGDAVRTRRPDVLFVDAPVSGSRAPAESGELVILASGPEDARATLDPVFGALGHRTVWLGSAGLGSRMKLVLNTWLAFEAEAPAEALALAQNFGISNDALANAVSGSPLVSPYAAAKLRKMQLADDSSDFALELALKDLTLVGNAGGSTHAPIAAAIAERWAGLVAQGAGALDVSAARLGL